MTKEERLHIYRGGPFRIYGSYASLPFYIDENNESTIAYKSLIYREKERLVIEVREKITISDLPVEDEAYTLLYDLNYLASKAAVNTSHISMSSYPGLLSYYKYPRYIYNEAKDVRSKLVNIFAYYFTSTAPEHAIIGLYVLRNNEGDYVGEAAIVCFSDSTNKCELDSINQLELREKSKQVTYELKEIFHKPRLLITRGKAEIKTYPLFVDLVTRMIKLLEHDVNRSLKIQVHSGLFEEYLIGGHIVSETDGIARFIPSPGLLKLKETRINWRHIPKNITRDVTLIDVIYNLTSIYEELYEFYQQVVNIAIELLKGHSITTNVTKGGLVVEDPKITLKIVCSPLIYMMLLKNLDLCKRPSTMKICWRALWATAPITYWNPLVLDQGFLKRTPLPFDTSINPGDYALYLVSQVGLDKLRSLYEHVEKLYVNYGKDEIVTSHAIILASAIDYSIERLRSITKQYKIDDIDKNIQTVISVNQFTTKLARLLAIEALVLGLHALSHVVMSRISKLFGVQKHSNINYALSEFIFVSIPKKENVLGDLVNWFGHVKSTQTKGLVIDGVIAYFENTKNDVVGGFSLIVKHEGSAFYARELTKELSKLDEYICEDLRLYAGDSDVDNCYTDWVQRKGIYEYGVREVMRSISFSNKNLSSRVDNIISGSKPIIMIGQDHSNPMLFIYPPFNTARRMVGHELNNIEKEAKTDLPFSMKRLLDAITLMKVPYCFDGCYACVMHDGCAYRFYEFRLLKASKYMAKLLCRKFSKT